MCNSLSITNYQNSSPQDVKSLEPHLQPALVPKLEAVLASDIDT